ncbi:MAG: transporter [Pseudonocardiales bacterium]|nr:transporter [Jatrophihabitantaceae bacterium]MCW2604197.1 transporter [Pseudonocardiales bacterium]
MTRTAPSGSMRHNPDAGPRMDFTPKPAAAPLRKMVLSQAAMEFRLIIRNGEQVALTLIVPLLLLVFFNLPMLYSLSDRRIDFVVPSILALGIMSSAFTGLAIGTGFERKYLVLKRLGATALPRAALVGGKTLAILLLEVVQATLICALGFALGWHPHGNPLLAVLLLVLGTLAFGGLGMLVAGTLRAEVVLAVANLVWLVLMFCGGIALPLSRFPDGVADVLRLLPSAALSEGLHRILQDGSRPGWGVLITLVIWSVGGLAAAARFFRWE